MSNGMHLLVRLVVAAAGSAAVIYWFHWFIGGKLGLVLGMVFSAPVIGMSLARPLVHVSHEGIQWLARQPLAKYQGRYYAFDSIQVRVEEYEDGLRFHAADIVRATQLRGIPARGHDYVDLATIEKWLGKRREPAAGKFLLWARREVVGPWEKKRSQRG